MKPHHDGVEWKMSAKVVILAVAVAIMALPVPASQRLAGTFSRSTHASAAEPSKTLGLLLQDPFLIDSLSYSAPKSFIELEGPAG
jgi:hypothetical protein